jgi:signal transduction histidine kinase
LDAALRSLAERSSIPAVIDSSLNGRLPDAVETTVYFAVSEALTNVAKYSQASSVAITTRQMNGSLQVVVADDGIGGADVSRGSGLRGLADRVAVVDGELEIDSPEGGGTRLELRIPVHAPSGTEAP